MGELAAIWIGEKPATARDRLSPDSRVAARDSMTAKSTRTPIVWLHGFPDVPETARALLEQLGFDRPVVAPYLRGYAPSPLPGPYDVETVAGDIVQLIESIGSPVDLVGHDWGAAITYTVCARKPELVRRAVTLACPHPRTLVRALRTPAQLRRSWYMAFFQLPFAARIARARDFALIDRLWRAWSPNFVLDDERRQVLHACLAKSWPAPLRYYGPQRFTAKRIETPLLQLHGADDGCILPPTGDDAFRFRGRVLEVVPNVGHFLHLEDPVGIALRISEWLS